MEEKQQFSTQHLTKKLLDPSNTRRLIIGVVVVFALVGVFSGYFMSGNSGKGGSLSSNPLAGIGAPKTASQDNTTFRDFAEGTIKAKPQPKDPSQYSEGTHVLERPGAVPVALTSSVVDLAQYEGKKVKVFGETQKALKEGWLMDVGKVEVEN